MTQAKRYQGERLRAEQWRNTGRDKAWARKSAGMPELEHMLHRSGFSVYCETRFDPVYCGYLIVTEVTKATPGCRALHLHNNVNTGCCEIIFTHEEPALEFPSDHLKTKLLMIAG